MEEAAVPGTVHLDLMKAGVLKGAWVDRRNWMWRMQGGDHGSMYRLIRLSHRIDIDSETD